MGGFVRDAPTAENGFIVAGTVSSRARDETFAGKDQSIQSADAANGRGSTPPKGARSGTASHLRRYCVKYSPHFWTLASAAPHGMIGTVEVEFFGEPSINLSE